MMPIVSVTLQPVTRQDGTTFTPIVEEAFCDAPGCMRRAPWGYVINGERRVYCSRHRLEVQQRRAG